MSVRRITIVGGAACLALGLALGSAQAQTAPPNPPKPPNGADPGAGTGTGASPIIGGGSNGNGGVIQGTPGKTAPTTSGSDPNAAKTVVPELSK